MRNILAGLSLALLLPVMASAQKEHVKHIMCPIDGTMFSVPVSEGFTVKAVSKDLEKLGDMGYYYTTMICSCPTCRYSGYHEDFGGPFSRRAKEDITRIIAPYKNLPSSNAVKCEVAAKLNVYFGDANDRIANIYLVGSYLLRSDRAQDAKRKELQRQSVVYFKKAIEAKEYTTEAELANTWYLIGELSRRVGDFHEAVKYLDMAVNSKGADDMITKYAADQKKAAINRDDNNSYY